MGGIKAQQKQIENLENRVVSLESRISSGNSGGVLAITDGILRVTSVFAKKVSVEEGIEIKDQVTGDTYCLTISNGEIVKNLGECSSTNNSIATDVMPGDTEDPVITLIGDNPINLEKGVTFIDPGATVEDNVNHNLGVYVDGAEIDTSVDATYTITYTATDQVGNESSIDRIVIVGTGSTEEDIQTNQDINDQTVDDQATTTDDSSQQMIDDIVNEEEQQDTNTQDELISSQSTEDSIAQDQEATTTPSE